MTAKTMYPAIGEQVLVDCQGIKPLCIVRDVKSTYGKYRFLVVPVAGVGEVWVEESRIQRADRPRRDFQPSDLHADTCCICGKFEGYCRSRNRQEVAQ